MEDSAIASDRGNDSTDPLFCFDLQTTPTWLLALHMTVLSAIILTSLLGNGTVLMLVARCKQLRSRSIIVSLSVVVVDLMLTLTHTVPTLASTAARRWPLSDSGCMAFSYLSLEAITTRWFTMAVLSIDRFSTVRFPFSYEKRSKGVLGVLTAAAWVLPVLMSAPVVAGFGEAAFRPNVPTCLFDCIDDRKCKFYYTGYFSIAFLFGAILPIVLYVWLYWKARQLRPSAMVLGRMAVQIASGAIITQPVAHLNGNPSERRARVTFVIIFITTLATSFPAYAFQFIRATNREVPCKLPLLIHFIVQEIFFLSVSLDPLVIMRDRNFRQCLRDLFCCRTSARTMGQDGGTMEHAANTIDLAESSKSQSARPAELEPAAESVREEQPRVLLAINGVSPDMFYSNSNIICAESTQL